MTARRRSAGFLIGLSIAAALAVAGLTSLGMWQVHRLAWKSDLIHKVESRIHAPPVPAPRRAGADDAYLRVSASGHFLHDRATLVQAVTAKGAGYWVMTPLVTDAGFTLLVNRGFVPPEAKARYDRPKGDVRVTGLLRMTEPRGGFLRSNDPGADRWYSRDVAAIGRARRLPAPLASYFVDSEAGPSPDSLPIGGLTVVKFANSHLSYAMTWFALAAMVAGAYIFLMRHEWKEGRA
ncbi:MAG TPA: SURF1 family protein [Sphingobium sp.]|nr:SURF1 family protein [Sphingobium sp.]